MIFKYSVGVFQKIDAQILSFDNRLPIYKEDVHDK